MQDDPIHQLLRGVDHHRGLLLAATLAVAALAAVSALRPPPAPGAVVWVASHDLPGGEPLRTGDVRAERVPIADVPHDALPAGERPAGRLLAAPVRAGEPLTDVRLLSPVLTRLVGGSGEVAVPVRVSDGPAALALVTPGERVDVLVSLSTDDPPVGATVEDPTSPTPTSTSTSTSAPEPTLDASPSTTAPPVPTTGATASGAQSGEEHLVASRVRVLAISPHPTDTGDGVVAGDLSDDGTGLVVLAVSRRTAQDLADAAQRGPLSLAVEAPAS